MRKKRGKRKKDSIRSKTLGEKILTSYLVFLAVLYLFYALVPGPLQAGISTFVGRLVNLFFVGLVMALIYGLLNRKIWALYLGIFWFAFEIFNTFVTMIIVAGDIVSSFVYTVSLYVILINSMIIWYLYATRKHFFGRQKVDKAKEIVFATSMILFLVTIAILFTVPLFEIYGRTQTLSSSILPHFHQKTFDESHQYCLRLDSMERDVCIFTLAAAYKNTPDRMCNEIRHSFYRSACLIARFS